MSTVAPTSPPLTRAAWRQRRFREELLIRASLAVVILFFNELSGLYGDAVGANPVTRAAGLGELLINGPYYLAARHGRWARGQAYFRMLMDIGFVTLGLYGAGGLAAAPSLGVYAIIIVYTGIMFSSAACLSATAVARSEEHTSELQSQR